ncbi:MAG: hypothetical protein WC570_03515 [Patescibacteria group bacterium]
MGLESMLGLKGLDGLVTREGVIAKLEKKGYEIIRIIGQVAKFNNNGQDTQDTIDMIGDRHFRLVMPDLRLMEQIDDDYVFACNKLPENKYKIIIHNLFKGDQKELQIGFNAKSDYHHLEVGQKGNIFLTLTRTQINSAKREYCFWLGKEEEE